MLDDVSVLKSKKGKKGRHGALREKVIMTVLLR